MNFDTFIHHIPQFKLLPLNAIEAHKEMAPEERKIFLNTVDKKTKKPWQSAVMILFYPKANDTYMVLIERSTDKGVHSAQIALPGGKWEESDKSLKITALRETEEEIGVETSKIEVIKELSPVYIPPSNFLVTPFLGVSSTELSFTPAPDEVANIIELPLSAFMSPENQTKVKMHTSYGIDSDVPAFVYNGNIIWGATAMVLGELKEMLLKLA